MRRMNKDQRKCLDIKYKSKLRCGLPLKTAFNDVINDTQSLKEKRFSIHNFKSEYIYCLKMKQIKYNYKNTLILQSMSTVGCCPYINLDK